YLPAPARRSVLRRENHKGASLPARRGWEEGPAWSEVMNSSRRQFLAATGWALTGLGAGGVFALTQKEGRPKKPADKAGKSLKGIDVSNYQGKIDWQAVKKSGVVFAFAKATEGVDFVDKSFAANFKAMKAAGIIRGAYHFARPGRGATE